MMVYWSSLSMEDIKGLQQREFTNVDTMYMLWWIIMPIAKLPKSLEQVLFTYKHIFYM